MHAPSHFRITSEKVIEQFIRENGFATLITRGGIYPAGTHIPVELETDEHGKRVLRGHISKANPQWKDFSGEPNVLVIFLSPVHSYISSSWYNHPNAPTWNYLSAHVTGKLLIQDETALRDSVSRLTDRYEKKMRNPVSLETLPDSVQKQLNGIVGFEVIIENMEASFKLSQNRNDEDYSNILKELRLSEDLNAKLMADVMERHRA